MLPKRWVVERTFAWLLHYRSLSKDKYRGVDEMIYNAPFYRSHLLDEVLPFWIRHAVDEKSGGIFTCLADDGTRISDEKYLWSQCRAIWTFAAAWNHIEKNKIYLELAETIADFVLKHGRDEQGRYFYKVSACGDPIDGPISIYSDFFAAYGLAELFRATGKIACLEEALRVLRQAVIRIREPDFNDLAPYSRPAGVGHIHGLSMILLETAQEIGKSATQDENIPLWCGQAAETIMESHVFPDRQCLLEHLDKAGKFLDTPAGRSVNPGHAIESMWFVIHHAQRRNDPVLARRACEVIRWHLEKGWDTEFGGLFLAVDIGGGEPWWAHAEKKLWWPHTEALYALHLADSLIQAEWCREWLERVTDYSFRRFPNPENGEWRQRLDRRGNPVSETVALPVKDPFHLPRALIRIIQLLEKPGLPVNQGAVGNVEAPLGPVAAALRESLVEGPHVSQIRAVKSRSEFRSESVSQTPKRPPLRLDLGLKKGRLHPNPSTK